MIQIDKTPKFLLAAVAVLSFAAEASYAQIIFDNGSVNVVDSPLGQHIIVRDSIKGTPTTVLIQTGADIPAFDPTGVDTSIFVEDTSTVEMSDGMTAGGFNTFDDSMGMFTGGVVGDEVESFGNSMMIIGTPMGNAPVLDIEDDLEAEENSLVMMYEGRVFDDVETVGTAVLNIFGGEFDEDVEAFDSSTINIFGGLFNTGVGDPSDVEGGKIEAENTAQVNVHGGTFVGALLDPDFESEDDGIITIFGTDFAVDGVPVGFGPLAAAMGQLTGTLEDGSMLDNDFEQVGNGVIILAEAAVGCDFEVGDANQDGSVDLLDVSAFVGIVTDGGFVCEADVNGDGTVDLLDVQPFIDILSGG